MSAALSLRHFDNDELDAHLRVACSDNSDEFIAKDVCAVLGLLNVSQALALLDEDEKGITISDTLGGKQKLLTVTESGLYALIFKSQKPEAKRFRKWVTSEVLPALRRGNLPQAITPEILALLPPRAKRALLDDGIAKLDRQIIMLRAQADLTHVIPEQFTVWHWMLLQGFTIPKAGVIANLSGQCGRLAAEKGMEVGEVKVIEHCGQRVRLTRRTKTYPDEILIEVCGRAD